MSSHPTFNWSDGAAYDRYVGRWSRLIASTFLDWLALPDARLWLDAGCGTGTLARAILERNGLARIHGVDRSFQYASFARQNLPAAQLHLAVADAQALPLAAGTQDAVVSGLVLNFVPDPARAAQEMARVTRAGGIVAAYVWDYSDKMQFMRYFWDAAVALDAGAKALDEGPRFALCHRDALERLFKSVDLQDVQVRAIDISTRFRDFDDYWSPFLGGQGPASVYLMSLSVERQAALRELLQERLPIAADGSIPLVARAWAARGRR